MKRFCPQRGARKFLPLPVFLLSLSIFASGCFREPESARKTVPEGARVYLQDRGLGDLSSVRESFALGDAIDYVNLDRNALETFPPELQALTGLKWLRLNSNRLSSLPDLSALVNLRRIYLRNNNFTQIPPELEKLPSLTDIDLSGNPISEVPEWLAKKEGLENLSFSATRIKRLPEDISAWKSLLSLQMGSLDISREEMARIRAALPKTAVVF